MQSTEKGAKSRAGAEGASGGSDGLGREISSYFAKGLVVFLTFCSCALFFFALYRYDAVAKFLRDLVGILQPVLIGLVLAYLLNPIMRAIERPVLSFLAPRMKAEKKAKKAARGIAILGSLAFLVAIIVLLLAVIIPSVLQSVEEIFSSLPRELNNLYGWVVELTKGDSQVASTVRGIVERASDALQTFVEEDLLGEVQGYIASIASGVIYGVHLIINIFVGLIISVYVMSSQETFAGQGKKILYAIFSPSHANVIVETLRKSNEIFGGFISGKLLDSAIIGIIAYVALLLMRMPDPLLIAVIIGVTNVIPFFGPFIGAIPSFIIVVLQNPIQSIYLLIFIFILQQVDGNIIGPKILGDSTGLSSFWVVFAILLFGGLWGFIGMLLGVPITAVIYYIITKAVSHRLRQRGLPEDTRRYLDLESIEEGTNRSVYRDEAPESRDAAPGDAASKDGAAGECKPAPGADDAALGDAAQKDGAKVDGATAMKADEGKSKGRKRK